MTIPTNYPRRFATEAADEMFHEMNHQVVAHAYRSITNEDVNA